MRIAGFPGKKLGPQSPLATDMLHCMISSFRVNNNQLRKNKSKKGRKPIREKEVRLTTNKRKNKTHCPKFYKKILQLFSQTEVD